MKTTHPITSAWGNPAGSVRNVAFFCGITLAGAGAMHAQLDPEPRQLLQLGYNQPLRGDGPIGAYGFYYWNQPDVPRTKMTLRLVLAPVYLDGELGFKGLLGEKTDVGVEVFGGGFYNGYDEVRQGNYYRSESFAGDGGGVNLSVYHLFNPEGKIPLNGIVRFGMNYHGFRDTDDTSDTFTLPDNQPFYTVRAGLRWGGREPVLTPRLAMEVSAWYELEYRPQPGSYGFPGGNWELNSTPQRFLINALAIYTFPRSEQTVALGLAGGGMINADRLSAFRLGGALRFTSEFPLYLPGYYYQELSAQAFGLIYGLYSIPFGAAKQWSVFAGGAAAVVDYLDGFGQPGNGNSGVGCGLSYSTRNRRLKAAVTFGYGIDAMRDGDRGGYSVGALLQYNFGKTSFASDRAFERLPGARLPIR